MAFIHELGARAPIRKAPFGDRCNHCGLCCASAPCAIAIKFLGVAEDSGRCRALEYENGRYWCGLVRNASRYLGTFEEGDMEIGQMIRELLGDGTCDSTTEEER